MQQIPAPPSAEAKGEQPEGKAESELAVRNFELLLPAHKERNIIAGLPRKVVTQQDMNVTGKGGIIFSHSFI